MNEVFVRLLPFCEYGGLIHGWACIWNGLSVIKHGVLIFGAYIRGGGGAGAYSRRFTVCYILQH